jgi:dipeptidyl aminopeptidase/acylaminoacyl peptidase
VRTDAGSEFMSLAHYSLDAERISHVQRPDWDVEEVAASADGRTLAWVVNVDGVSPLHATRDGDPVPLPDLPPGVISPLALSADGRLAAFLFNTATRPTEVAVVDLRTGELRLLTDSRPAGLTGVEPVTPELVRYPTHDGRTIPAWLFRPAGTGSRFPVVLSIHGGPEAQERPAYAYSGLYQYLLSRGIGVLAPNVRGSTGYGKSYQRLIHRDFGGAELGDFEHTVTFLRSLDWVRPDRIGVFGGSFGGFATLSCVSRLPSLWAAGVSIVGPSNLVTFARSVPPTWRPLMARWVGDPETEADFLLERSPITYADDIVAPLFIIQGAKDPRVVQAESDQIVAKLRERGVDVRYDVYPDEGHGFTSKDNELRAWSSVAEFLCTRLAG